MTTLKVIRSGVTDHKDSKGSQSLSRLMKVDRPNPIEVANRQPHP
jgi:hypothetical protein